MAEFLSVERIDTDLQGGDKADALRALAGLLAGAGPSGHDTAWPTSDEIHRALLQREALGSTGVGDGVAIPHGRLPAIDCFAGALAIRRGGVPFEAVDGRPVSIMFALIGPERAAGEHLKCLARISRVLRDPGVRERLRAAEGAGSARRILIDADG